MSKTKSYGWDNSAIVFGDPFEHTAKKEKKLEVDRERGRKLRKVKGELKNRKNFHLKHG